MKVYEVKKGETDIERGRVMMAIEGTESKVQLIVELMKNEGYYSTQCAEYGDKDGELIEYFMISRADKSDFLKTYKNFK